MLKETLGKLPLFAQQLDPDFQMEVFPLIKPVSYAKHEVVFQRGEPSRDLIFLLKGEVSVLSPLDNAVTSVITPTEEVVLSKTTGKNKPQVRRFAPTRAHWWISLTCTLPPACIQPAQRPPPAGRST